MRGSCAVAVAVVATGLWVGGCNGSDPGGRRQGGTASAPREEASDGGAGASAAARSPTRPATAPSTRPATFTGTLRGSAVAIGGETTGWRLEGDNQTGGIDVDVSRLAQRARSLDGKRVSISGKMTTRNWVERGETQVLVADRIEEAPAPQPGAGRAPAR
jgi:hypothetical protein